MEYATNKGEINGYKTNIHPKEFFTDKAQNKNGESIVGSKYISDYDFLFPINQTRKLILRMIFGLNQLTLSKTDAMR